MLAAAVAGGQVVHPDRASLERLVAPAEPERLRRREELLVAEVERDPDGVLAGLGTAGAPGDGPATALAVVDAAVADAVAGRLELDDRRVVALATVLAEPALRDAALLRCAGPHAAAAEQLWAALTRETPDPEAAEPAALLAVSAMLRGDGRAGQRRARPGRERVAGPPAHGTAAARGGPRRAAGRDPHMAHGVGGRRRS
ncbi:hypothetical protein BJF78_08755 [Pseudonocardia sp. CNS-139]|nr:hypothetical protein BJF78_08755 [Pseudonocardia sp. CNS-139]